VLGSTGFGLAAGALSTLSPCVLPIVPIVLATAAGQHRFGPLALAAGLALSFTAIGLFVATIGFALGFDAGMFRAAGGVALVALGTALLAPALSTRAALAAGPASGWAERRLGPAVSGVGLAGQFGVGLLLGVVWSPCVGPTLGAALLMAARGESLGQVALTMLAFGAGAALPLLLLGLASREALLRWRGRMLAAGAGGRRLMGAGLVAVGALVLTGVDKRLEALMVEAGPAWLTRLTTAF
jgi:cytochrome c biogenesis protein CcdA